MTFSISIFLIFLIYLVLWIQIPGLMFVDTLLPRRLKFSTRLLAGFFIGFVYMAGIYYIESLTGLQGLITVAGPVTSLLAASLYYKKGRPSLFNATERFRWTYVIVFAIVFVISMVNFQFKYLFAYANGTTQVYHDFLFHTGNIVSLSRSFPNADIRIAGLTFFYHYFYELLFAMCKHIFKMDAFRLYMNGNAMVCAFPLTMALATIGERIRGVKVCAPFRYFFYCTGLLVSCICLLPLNVGGTRLPFSWMDNHFFSNANAMGLALSLTIVVIDILAEIWYDKLELRNVLAMFILSVAATGFKGTTGALLVGITWSVFIIELLITRSFHLPKLLYNLALTIGFIACYVLVTVGMNPSGANNRAMALTCEGTLQSNRVGAVFAKLGIDYMAFPWVIIAVVLSIICILGPCIIPFTAFTKGKFETLIKDGVIGDIFDWFAIGSVIMGLIGFCFVSVPGFSQGYFVITNAGLVFYCTLRYMTDNPLKGIYKLMQVFFCIGTLFLIVDVASFCRDDINQVAVYSKPAGDRPDLVSSDMMEAYFWLRDNTEEDSVVAVDRLSEELDYRNIYFYCSAFSERQCYLEGYDYSDISEKQVEAMLAIQDRIFGDNPVDAELAMDVNGISYIVVSKLENPNYKPTTPRLRPVFINEEVTIYKYD